MARAKFRAFARESPGLARQTGHPAKRRAAAAAAAADTCAAESAERLFDCFPVKWENAGAARALVLLMWMGSPLLLLLVLVLL